ncbi:MAG: septal ring lytic transglycosylase RlpA family protein [Gammaproteobacteria bacterium]
MRALLALALIAAVAACSPFARKDTAPRHPPDVSRVPDAVPQPAPRSARGNPPFYEVFGVRYHVLDSSADYRERGVASWYGEKFHGVSTASGVPYDMYAMTAAHRTLPLPTWAKVTNLRNGLSVVVKINDRGPFAHNRLIDLSYSAAKRLDMIADGTTMVEIEALEPGIMDDDVPVIASAPAPAGAMYVQVGAFGDADNAEALKRRLVANGVDNVVIRRSRDLYRVRIGPLADVAAFDETVARMSALDITDTRLVME